MSLNTRLRSRERAVPRYRTQIGPQESPSRLAATRCPFNVTTRRSETLHGQIGPTAYGLRRRDVLEIEVCAGALADTTGTGHIVQVLAFAICGTHPRPDTRSPELRNHHRWSSIQRCRNIRGLLLHFHRPSPLRPADRASAGRRTLGVVDCVEFSPTVVIQAHFSRSASQASPQRAAPRCPEHVVAGRR